MFLFLLAVLLSLAAAQSCSSHQSCSVCQKFTDSASPSSSSPCQWCVSGSLSVGCFAYGKCPGSSSPAYSNSCPLTDDTCSLIQSCSDCANRIDCQYCAGYGYGSSRGAGYGCVSSKSTCPSSNSFAVNSPSQCANMNGSIIAMYGREAKIGCGYLFNFFLSLF